MSLKHSIVILFLLTVIAGCGGDTTSSTPAGTNGAPPAEAAAQPVLSAGNPAEP
jgi:hypothetical protein